MAHAIAAVRALKSSLRAKAGRRKRGLNSARSRFSQAVFMAVAMDLGDPSSPLSDVHPRYKKPVGQRLAQGALAVAYGPTSQTPSFSRLGVCQP